MYEHKHPFTPPSDQHLAMQYFGARLAEDIKSGHLLSTEQIRALKEEYYTPPAQEIQQYVGAVASHKTEKDFLQPDRQVVHH